MAKRKGGIPVDFARVPATSICRDSSGVYRQLPDPANFWLLGVIGHVHVDYHVTREENRGIETGCSRYIDTISISPFSPPPKSILFPLLFKTFPDLLKHEIYKLRRTITKERRGRRGGGRKRKIVEKWNNFSTTFSISPASVGSCHGVDVSFLPCRGSSLLHARESNHRAAQGKRNFRGNKLRGNTKNGHFADVAPPALLLRRRRAFPCAPFHRSFPSTGGGIAFARVGRIGPRYFDRVVAVVL